MEFFPWKNQDWGIKGVTISWLVILRESSPLLEGRAKDLVEILHSIQNDTFKYRCPSGTGRTGVIGVSPDSPLISPKIGGLRGLIPT